MDQLVNIQLVNVHKTRFAKSFQVEERPIGQKSTDRAVITVSIYSIC